jgi:hypothetical protein
MIPPIIAQIIEPNRSTPAKNSEDSIDNTIISRRPGRNHNKCL